jgi:MoxR-like ATPase
MAQYIPQRDRRYVPRHIYGGITSDLEVIKKVYETRRNLLLEGPTGAGKTHAIRHICAELGLPYIRIPLSADAQKEDLVGQFVPMSDGTFAWSDGLLTQACRYGGVVVLDELNACPPDITTALHQVLDDERRLSLTSKDGEVIELHPDTWIVATMNPPDYNGVSDMNQAFDNRFQCRILYEYDEGVEKVLIRHERLLRLARTLRLSRDITTPVSTRGLMAYMENLRTFGLDAAKDMFLAGFKPTERRAVLHLWELHIDDSSIVDGELMVDRYASEEEG